RRDDREDEADEGRARDAPGDAARHGAKVLDCEDSGGRSPNRIPAGDGERPARAASHGRQMSELPKDWRERNERAIRQLRGEEVEPELVEVKRVLVIEADQLACSWCSSHRLSLGAVAALPNPAEPDAISIWMSCAACGTRFLVGLVESPSGVEIRVEEA